MTLLGYLWGPALFRIYRNLERGEPYVGNTLERYGSNIIFCLTMAYNIGIYFVPPYLGYQILTKRGDYVQASTVSAAVKYMGSIGCVFFFAALLRAIGRTQNPVYREFLEVYRTALKDPSPANKARLRIYDAETSAYPIDFTMRNQSGSKRSYLEAPNRGSGFTTLFKVPYKVIAWIMTHTFGLKLVYPGSIQLLQAGIKDPLDEGREKCVIEKNGRRIKIETVDKNLIDGMFMDRRKTDNPNGNILVIACEGNAGFYEIGVMGSPLDAGYSVLGWNHPGFAGSTGSPFPSQVTNAMDAIMQYSLQELKFHPEQIILHGWSIGGFPVSWAAMNYPDVKAVILDATFDTLLPLALEKMPQFLEPLVQIAIEDYMNLDVINQINKYNGPVRFIRRSHDEIITTKMNDRSSNRGNNLLIGVLKHRYPELVGQNEESTLIQYLNHDETGQRNFLSNHNVIEHEMLDLIQSLNEDEASTRNYPSSIGKDLIGPTKEKLVLFLASRYMVDFDSTHCSPLPAHLFTLPWVPPASSQNDFVKI